jgi:hypothetical protein
MKKGKKNRNKRKGKTSNLISQQPAKGIEIQAHGDSPTDQPANNQPLPTGSTPPRKSHTEAARNAQTHSHLDFKHQQSDPKPMSPMTPFEIVSLIISAFTVILVGLTATVYYHQLREMRKATKATEIAARAAEEGLVQSKKAFEASSESVRIDQRAWIGLFGISFSPPFSDTNETIIRVVIQNTGKVPATFKAGMNARPAYEFPPKENMGIIGDTLANGVLFSGATTEMMIPYKPIPGNDPPYIVINGYIWYEDEFGKHSTSFCFYKERGSPRDESLQMAPTNNWFK